MQRTLILIGLALIVIGLVWPWLTRLPFGRLPGDLVFERGAGRFYFPLVTCLVLSALVSVLLWIFRR
jgi:hypothetical protein